MKGLVSIYLLIIIQTLFFSLVPRFSTSQEFIGSWKGKIQADTLINVEIYVMKQDTSLAGVILVKPKFCLFSDSSFNGKVLHLRSVKEKFAFTGMLTENKNQLSGEFTINGMTYPVNLFRGDKPAYRPQEPKGPFPYYSEEVTFRNEKDSVTLSGTLTIPMKEGRFPAVILQGGSLPGNRDGEGNFHKPFLVIADYLSRHGIAVLRYDDRGIGRSTGNFLKSTAVDLAGDLVAGYACLSSRQDIQKNNIGLLGHSEGGLVAGIAATQTDKFKFTILCGAPGISIRNLFPIQYELKYYCGDISEDDYARSNKTRKLIDSLIACNKSSNEITSELSKDNNEYFKSLPDSQRINIFLSEYLRFSSMIKGSEHYLFLRQAIPYQYYQKLSCPVLSLNGSKDIHVPAGINQAAIRQALIKGGNKDFKVIELEGLNHFFQECDTGSENEAKTLEQTYSPKALEIIKEWILQHVNTE